MSLVAGDDDYERKAGGKANKESGANGSIVPKKANAFPVKPKGWGSRHTLAFLGFWAFAISYAMRFNLSIAIVAMVNNTKSAEGHGNFSGQSTGNFSGNFSTIHEEACVHLKPNSSEGDVADVHHQAEFFWNQKEQGLILGSFFWGYVITQLPGGILATKYGGKWTLGLGLFITAIFAILTPVLARTHVHLLIMARVIQGLGEGVTTPAMHAILAVWAPANERSMLGSIVYAGAQFGTAVTMVISGYLIHGGVMGGWPSVFYIIGGFSLIWFILWSMFVFDTPASHPRISEVERIYIEQSILEGGGGGSGAKDSAEGGKAMAEPEVPTPWLKMFTSVPMWAILVAHVGHAYGLYTILTMLPTYLKTALHFDIKQNSWINAIPYLVMWITGIGTTMLADHVVAKKWFPTVTTRKFCQAFGHIASAIALVAVSYSGCDRKLTVLLLTIAVGVNGVIYGGYVVNHVDIAPNWAGILMGITNTFANLTGFAAPYVAGSLINENPSIQNWQYVFFIAAGIYLFDVVVYVLFASGTEQPWNKPKEEDTQMVEVKPPSAQSVEKVQ